MLKVIRNLTIPFNDAIDYKDPDKLGKFLEQYNVTSAVNKLDQPNTYYVIGEKGTGKTAISLYYISQKNNDRNRLTPLSETFFERFVYLKRNDRIKYADYVSIWRCLIMANCAKVIVQKSSWISKWFLPQYWRLRNAIRDFEINSTKPEVDILYEYIEKIATKGTLSIKKVLGGEVSGESQRKKSISELFKPFESIETGLRKALSTFSCKYQCNLFFDGIDAKPTDVTQDEYEDVLKSLASAARQLNSEVFKNMRKHQKKFRVVLLLRPDIFVRLGLYNSTSIVIDNSVLLTWETSIRNFKNSDLFKTIDKYFYSQNNNNKNCGWDAYFRNGRGQHQDIVFVELLDRSLQRPRDYFTAVKYLVTKYINEGREGSKFQTNDTVGNTEFLRNFSLYLLGEVQNYASFYMSTEDFDHYRQFFKHLDDPYMFTATQYKAAFSSFVKYADSVEIRNRSIYSDETKLLQFFYEVNIIGYREKQKTGYKFHFAYRDRSIYNINPKIKTSGVSYILAKGIRRALDL